MEFLFASGSFQYAKMYRNLFIYTLLLLVCTHVRAQPTRQQKHEIQFFYAPGLSKTYFDRSIANSHFGFGVEFYETAKPRRPVPGYSYGILYARKVSKRAKIYFGMKRNLVGQASPVAYNFRGIIPLDTLPGYGGLKYQILMWSYSFSIGYQKKLFQNDCFEFALGAGTGIDFYDKAIFKDYIVQRENGTTRPGCCIGYYYKSSTFQKIHDFFYPIKKGIYRAEVAVLGEGKVLLPHGLYLCARPEFRFLTNLIGASSELEPLVPQGLIWSLNLNLGLGLHF